MIPPNNQWLYDYYSGVSLKEIGKKIFRHSHAITDRVKRASLPTRPRGNFTDKVRETWLARADIKMLRRIFKNV